MAMYKKTKPETAKSPHMMPGMEKMHKAMNETSLAKKKRARLMGVLKNYSK